mgnify:FL=1
MFNQDPHVKFSQDYAEFSYSAAFRQFISDNLTLGLIILAVSGIAAISNGAKGVLSHRRVGTVLLVLMVCRAFHAGANANRPRINIKDVTPEENDDSSKDS